MSKARVVIGTACVAALLSGVYFGEASYWRGVEQPIAFNHKKHIGLGIECETCHPGVHDSRHAGITSVKTCVTCHQAAQVSNPEAKKLEVYLSKGQEPPWKRVYHLPPERYNLFWRPYASRFFFSHRLHVKIGGIACAACHGDMKSQSTPLSFPKKRIRMMNCLNCHRKMSVSTDCLACHH
jgi:hypothetical protein